LIGLSLFTFPHSLYDDGRERQTGDDKYFTLLITKGESGRLVGGKVLLSLLLPPPPPPPCLSALIYSSLEKTLFLIRKRKSSPEVPRDSSTPFLHFPFFLPFSSFSILRFGFQGMKGKERKGKERKRKEKKGKEL